MVEFVIKCSGHKFNWFNLVCQLRAHLKWTSHVVSVCGNGLHNLIQEKHNTYPWITINSTLTCRNSDLTSKKLLTVLTFLTVVMTLRISATGYIGRIMFCRFYVIHVRIRESRWYLFHHILIKESCCLWLLRIKLHITRQHMSQQ